MTSKIIASLVIMALACVCPGSAWADGPRVNLVKAPHGGIQPQGVVDAQGVLHLLYFKGDPAGGDLFYLRRKPGQESFSQPIRVNSQPASAIAVGTIRGGQFAIGSRGRVHVVWNGSGKALPKNAAGHNPMLYARLNDAGTVFEPQRNLMRVSDALDGGGTVAADSAGNVYVVWHGLKIDSAGGETNRQVWLTQSKDDGQTFTPETTVNPEATGACGCCGMRAFVDSNGAIHALYRAAKEGIQRDMILLSSRDRARRFDSVVLDKWTTGTCPMSSEAFAEGSGSVYAAWETEGQVYFARMASGTAQAGKPLAAPGPGQNRKHPAVAVNPLGELILVWTEGTGWQRGGALAWQVYDKTGRPTEVHGRVAGAIPVWGLASVAANKDGTFTIIY